MKGLSLGCMCVPRPQNEKQGVNGKLHLRIWALEANLLPERAQRQAGCTGTRPRPSTGRQGPSIQAGTGSVAAQGPPIHTLCKK